MEVDDVKEKNESAETIDTEECIENEIVINEEVSEHELNEDEEVVYENHSDYSDYRRESETLQEMDCSIVSDSNLSDTVNLTMDSVTEAKRRMQKQIFPEADLVINQIEEFMQESPIVKSSTDNHDNHDSTPNLPSPVPTLKKTSEPVHAITPTRVVSRKTVCERADQSSPSSAASMVSSTLSRTNPLASPSSTPSSRSDAPPFPRMSCHHPGITTHIKLPRRYVKARRQRVVKVTEGISKIQVNHKLKQFSDSCDPKKDGDASS